MSRTRKLVVSAFAVLAFLTAAVPAVASQPPGQLGYEGHSGNQGGPDHHP